MTRGLANEYGCSPPEADADLAEAERLASSFQPNLLGEVYVSRGTLEIQEQKYAEAEKSLRRALSLSRDRGDRPLESTALANLALVATKEEHYDEAIEWNQSALMKYREFGPQSTLPKLLGNMGWNYFQMGDYVNALDLYEQARSESVKLGITGDSIIWLIDIGDCYFQTHDLAGAEASWRASLDLAQKLDKKDLLAQSLNNLSQLDLSAGHLDQAARHNSQALSIEKAADDAPGMLYSQLIAARIEAARKNFAEAEQLYESVIQGTKESSVRWEAESRLAELLAQSGRSRQAEQLFRKSIDTIEGLRSSITHEDFRLSFLSSPIQFFSSYIDFLVSQNRPNDALQVVELSRCRTLAEGLGISQKFSLPIEGFEPSQTAARYHAVILTYWLGTERSYLWAISPKRTELFILPSAAEIRRLAQSYRKTVAVDSVDVLATQNPVGLKLFEILVAPAQKFIEPQSRVIILADDALYGLNFETLLVGRPTPHLWIEDVVIDYANSFVVLSASTRASAPPSRKILIEGNPVSPDPAHYPDLPQAPAEIKRIVGHFAPAERVAIERQQATPAAYFDSRPEQFRFIHFDAHGIASVVTPLDSAVILTRQGDSFKLYARDIVAHPIRAEMVTISACNGNDGRTYSGEGLVGLNWAFLRAGARQVISALWEVDDNSTLELMDHLYAKVTKGAPADEALRDAKLALLHSTSVYRKPFFWAPFELYRGI